MGALARVLGHEPRIERMKRQLDDRVALSTLEAAIVTLAHGLRERLDGRPQGGSADRVQLAADENRPIVPDRELQPALLDRDALLPRHTLPVEHVPSPV